MLKNKKQMRLPEIKKLLLKRGFKVSKLKKSPANKELKNLYFTTLVSIFIIALFFWEPINFGQVLIFILMGSSGLLSHWCMNQSLKMSETTFVMPLQFSKLFWASIIGVLLFSENPDFWTWVGAVIIFISVIYITYREAFVKKEFPQNKQVDSAIIH